MKKRICVSSQYFGYGPTSNLFVVLGCLKKKTNIFEVHAIDNESLNIFDKQSPGIIDHIANDIDIKKFDLVLSSFDPILILESWLHNVKTIFYCNLFWYWNVYDKKYFLISFKKTLTKLKNKKKYEEAKKIFLNLYKNNFHLGIFMGFFLADYSFTRRFPSIEVFHDVFIDQINLRVFDIYVPYFLKKERAKRQRIFFQLSGGRNCVVSDEENCVYFNCIIALAMFLVDNDEEFEVIICANPKILELVNLDQINIGNKIKIIPSQRYQKNLQLIEESLAIFSSPGMETIYEAIYTGCPIFLLPEQNAGQFSIFQLLKSTGFNPDRFLINEVFPARNKLLGEEDVHEVYKLIHGNLLHSTKYQRLFFERAVEFLQKMKVIENRENYLNMSLNAIKLTTSCSPFSKCEAVSDFIVEQFS